MNVREHNAGDMQNLLPKSSLSIPRQSLMGVNKNSSLCVNFFELFVTEFFLIFFEVALCFAGAVQYTIFGKHDLIKINTTLNISIACIPV